jgi:Na+/H+ antiporter NhaD/arsenite permease-like protein
VGFFLAGLVIHGRLQAWWIAPVLSRLGELPLFAASCVLTSFNDNALITYLATLAPHLDQSLKLAVVQGAVSGGGLTVIANAPNPAGQALLARYFGEAVEPAKLFAGAVVPTLIAAAAFLFM